MRILIALLLLALRLSAESRASLLNRIALAETGQPVRIVLNDRTTLAGRLLSVRTQGVILQVPVSGALAEREIAFSDVRSFKQLKASEFGRSVRKGFGVTLGVFGVIMALALLGAALGG